MKNKKTILTLIILVLVWFGIQALMEKPSETPVPNNQTDSVVVEEESATVESFDEDIQTITEEESSLESEITELESLSF